MKAAVLEKIREIKILEVDVPGIADNEVLIKIKSVGICASDLHYYLFGELNGNVLNGPLILGHEASGIVSKVGKNVSNLKPGDRVAIEPGIPCQKCDYCKNGKYNLCDSIRFMSVPSYNGALREFLPYNPQFVHKIPDNLSFDEAALIEPLSVGYYSVLESGIFSGDLVMISGFGPIGIACYEMIKLKGASKIIVSDINDYRLNIAKKHGALITINPSLKNILDEIDKYTNSNGVDRIFETSGSSDAIKKSLDMVKKGGKIALIGMGEKEITISYTNLVRKNISLEGMFRYANTYKPIIRLLESNLINLNDWISHKFKFEDINKAIDLAIDPNIDNMKIIINL